MFPPCIFCRISKAYNDVGTTATVFPISKIFWPNWAIIIEGNRKQQAEIPKLSKYDHTKMVYTLIRDEIMKTIIKSFYIVSH